MLMKIKIISATVLAVLLAVAAAPSYSDHVQITISLVSGTEDECSYSVTCVSLSAATLDVGGEIIWANDGSETITLTSGKSGDHHAGDDFGPLDLDPGQTYSRIFDEAGEIHFHIVDSPWMAGSINVVSDEEHTHDDSDGYMHATMEASEPLAIGMDVAIEDGGGINIHIMTEGWRWTPENVNEDHVPGEGHAYIYVDGVKTSVYTPYYHIPGLEAGSHHIRVALHANNHDEMHVNGFPVEAVATVIVNEDDHEHEHEPAPVDGTALMSIDATAHVDATGGYNLEVDVTDFVISGEGVDGEHVPGEGYAVVSIDDTYHNRLYGDWIQIPALEPGTHTITVSLFAYDHSPYHWDGEPIETSVTVKVSDHDPSDHAH